MKILVTGGAGFIGTNLIKRLVDEGHQVLSLDDYSTGTKGNHIQGVTYWRGDIETIEFLNGKFDLCYHIAAQSRVQPSFEEPTECFRVNVKGTQAVMEWAKAKNVKVIYAGSSSKHHDPSDSPYAMYKYLGEEVCKLYKKSYNVDVQIARFYNVYGPSESLDEKNGNVIGIWRKKILTGQKLPIVGDGEQRRDFTHVDDIVDGLIRISKTDKVHEDAWELGSGVNYSVNELFSFFKEKFDCESISIPDQKGNYRETLNINPDAFRYLDWQPQDRLKDYIQSL
jgi:UDP-glucose 4-epimerase